MNMTLRELSLSYGISVSTIRDRIKRQGLVHLRTQRRNGVYEYPVTDDFFRKVINAQPKPGVKEVNSAQLSVKSLNVSSTGDEMELKFVFNVREFREFIYKLVRS